MLTRCGCCPPSRFSRVAFPSIFSRILHLSGSQLVSRRFGRYSATDLGSTGSLGPILKPIWGQLGANLGQLGASWGSRGAPKRFRTATSAQVANLGPTWAQVEAILSQLWGHFGKSLGLFSSRFCAGCSQDFQKQQIKATLKTQQKQYFR